MTIYYIEFQVPLTGSWIIASARQFRSKKDAVIALKTMIQDNILRGDLKYRIVK